MHAAVARSTFPSQQFQKLTDSDHFLTFRCRKSTRRCGPKHISKSTVSKTYGFRPFLDVQMSEKVHALVARIICRCAQKHFTTLHCTTQHFIALHYIQLHDTTLHSITLPYTALHCATFHYTTLHSTLPQSTPLH